jgi:hypothetical protein
LDIICRIGLFSHKFHSFPIFFYIENGNVQKRGKKDNFFNAGSDHPLGDYSILALATISKVIVVTVKPRLKVLLTTPLTGENENDKYCLAFFVTLNIKDLRKRSDIHYF